MKKIIFYIAFVIGFGLMAQNEVTFEIKNLDINTKYADFGTLLFNNNQVIYASAKRGFGNTSGVWKENKQPFLDLYQGEVDANGEISNSKRMSDAINSRYHEATVALSSNLKTLYFTRDNYLNKKKIVDATRTSNLGIYKVNLLENGEWSNPIPFQYNNKNYSCGHPALSPDGKRLYFVSDMQGSNGKTDIFYVTINDDGSYGNPTNLGAKINTEGREEFPFISSDNVLYFSSDGRNGFGQLDIYSVDLNNSTADVKHLEAPFNSTFDDFSYIVNNTNLKGYFSSNRDGGKGDDDIYYFEPKVIKVCKQTIEGKVVESDSKAKITDATVTLYDVNSTPLKSVVVDANASYNFEIECSENYQLKAVKNGYIDNTISVTSTDEDLKKVNLDIDLTAEKVEFVKQEEKVLIKINPIYFDLNSANIRKDAEDELKKVVDIMIKYPDIIIECGSHTDSRAGDNYNMSLSERRAQQTIKYIVSKGISPERISGKGYGETQLVNKCSNGVKCKESEHQLNRRTEFKVIRTE